MSLQGTKVSRVTLDNVQFAKTFVESMHKHCFMSSEDEDAIRVWTQIFGDKKQVHINSVEGNASNLLLYCGWTIEEIKEYIYRCGYFIFEYEQTEADEFSYLHKGKHWVVSRDTLRPGEKLRDGEFGATWRQIWLKESVPELLEPYQPEI